MSTAIEYKTTDRGERLANGAVLIDKRFTYTEARATGHMCSGYCIALRADSSYHEFVTWRYVINPELGEFTTDGRYFDTLDEAVKDYMERIGA